MNNIITNWLLKNRRIRNRSINIYNYDKPHVGRALVSYRPDSIKKGIEQSLSNEHSNIWESAQIIKTFNELGFIVDAIWYDDTTYKISEDYDVIFDIHRNLGRYVTSKTKLKIFYATGSYPLFSNKAELLRVRNLEKRRNIKLKPRRYMNEKGIKIFNDNIKLADKVILIGNRNTLDTFPSEMLYKIHLLNPTSNYNFINKLPNTHRKEFLWYNGYGALHKGLDLVLEIFSRRQDLILNVVGAYEREKDFVKAYYKELYKLPNIRAYGFLLPSSDKFKNIVRNVISFISPSCSEGVSTSAITCMQFGLIPIISLESGITLTKDIGIILKENSIEEIINSINFINGLTDEEINKRKQAIYEFTRKVYSRENYKSKVYEYIKSFLNK